MRRPDAGVAWLSSHPLKSRGLKQFSPAGGLVLGCLLQSWIWNRPVWCGMSCTLSWFNTVWLHTLYMKNRTPVQFHRIREASLFQINTEQCLGSFLRIKEMTERASDLNHTICNQKHHIFCSSSFLEFLKAVYFSKPSILTAHGYISSTEYQFLSTVCSQEPFRMFSLGDEQFRTSFFWDVTFSHLFVWERRKETLNEIPLRRVLEKAGEKNNQDLKTRGHKG